MNVGRADGRPDADVVVIGAGASGIGVARLLATGGRRVVVLERHGAAGQSWRRRYDRLRLHTARRWSHVAGSRLRRTGDRFIAAADYAAHVADAARGLDVRFDARVTRVCPADDGRLEVHVAGRAAIVAADVVLATGQNDVPVEPLLEHRSDFRGEVRHVDTYRNGREFTDRRVLVVGAGNSGTEVAQDLVEHGARSVAVAVRSVPAIVPRAVGPVPAHGVAVVLARLLGMRGMRAVTRAVGGIGGRIRLARFGLYPPTERGADGVPTMDHGFVQLVADGAIQLTAGVSDLDEHGAVLMDGSTLPCDAVLLATGYRPAALELLDDVLRGDATAEALHDPFALAGRHVWSVGFGPAPLGQLVLARQHATLVARAILRRARP